MRLTSAKIHVRIQLMSRILTQIDCRIYAFNNKVDDIFHGKQLLAINIININVEFIFNCHYNFNLVKRVKAQIIEEMCFNFHLRVDKMGLMNIQATIKWKIPGFGRLYREM